MVAGADSMHFYFAFIEIVHVIESKRNLSFTMNLLLTTINHRLTRYHYNSRQIIFSIFGKFLVNIWVNLMCKMITISPMVQFHYTKSVQAIWTLVIEIYSIYQQCTLLNRKDFAKVNLCVWEFCILHPRHVRYDSLFVWRQRCSGVLLFV